MVNPTHQLKPLFVGTHDKNTTRTREFEKKKSSPKTSSAATTVTSRPLRITSNPPERVIMTSPSSLDFSEPATRPLAQTGVNKEDMEKTLKRKPTIGDVLWKTDRPYAKVLTYLTTILDQDDGGTDFSSIVELYKAQNSPPLDRNMTKQEIEHLFEYAREEWRDADGEDKFSWDMGSENDDEDLRSQTASEILKTT